MLFSIYNQNMNIKIILRIIYHAPLSLVNYFLAESALHLFNTKPAKDR